MRVAAYQAGREAPTRESLAYQARVLRVIAMIDFKLKYLDSALGYLWSVAKPLSYFAVIWALLGGIFKAGVPIERYPLYLLIGLVIYGYFVESVGMAMSSIVSRTGLLRRVYFPRIVVPLAATATAAVTFFVNTLAVVVFIAISRVQPGLDWLLLVPLLLELYVVILGLGLIMATLFVRFRDIGQLWDLSAQLLLFAMPVMYSISFMPPRVQKLLVMNPVAQVLQDIRYVILGPDRGPETIAGIYGGAEWRLVPIGFALVLLAIGLYVFRRESPFFAERI